MCLTRSNNHEVKALHLCRKSEARWLAISRMKNSNGAPIFDESQTLFASKMQNLRNDFGSRSLSAEPSKGNDEKPAKPEARHGVPPCNPYMYGGLKGRSVTRVDCQTGLRGGEWAETHGAWKLWTHTELWLAAGRTSVQDTHHALSKALKPAAHYVCWALSPPSSR